MVEQKKETDIFLYTPEIYYRSTLFNTSATDNIVQMSTAAMW